MGWGCQVGHKSSPEELQTPLVLQPMQCARHLETAATQLLGQAYHLDDHTLGAYGVAAVAMDKVDDAAVDAFAVAAPTAGVSLLDKRREKIEVVDTEDRKTVYQLIDFVFADTDDAQVRQFLSQCAHQADRLQSRLFYRNALLQKILLVAAQQQAAYFVGGEKKPLRQKDVAALLGVNVSTISRAIQGKYISVDGRCIRVRELFSRPSAGNRARSTHSIQQQILALIEAEDPQRPLSDQKIHEQLAQSGVAVSRRLIAKYRALAQIPSAYARKITRESTGRNVVSAGGEKE